MSSSTPSESTQQQPTTQTQPDSSAPILCQANCGFFGSPKTDNYCSKCYKEKQQAQQKPTETQNNQQLSSNQTPSAAILSITSPNGNTHNIQPLATQTIQNQTITLAPIANENQNNSNNNNNHSILNNNNNNSNVNASPVMMSTNIAASSPSASPLLGPSAHQSSPSFSPQTSPSASPSLSPNKVPKKRCTVCKKKVGMDYFTCRCNSDHMFCAAHRLPHSHNCPHDHKKDQQNKIEKQNPIVKNKQFEMI